MDPQAVDIFIIGGGINGAAVARDAAGRGASVILCEQGDLASATSSASTKLIHGGLRYLEYGEFALVREALLERERFLRAAPHIIWPLTFVLPQNGAVRPAWLVRLGLFLYDHLAPRQALPKTRTIRLADTPMGRALRSGYDKAFLYADCWVQDSRLVILNAMAAAERGAEILPRTRCISTQREQDQWRCKIMDASGQVREIAAKTLVNAAGPWTGSVRTQQLGIAGKNHIRMIRGSHIVLPRLYEGDFAYLLQNPDKRIIFAIPFEQHFTLIGTTDVPFTGDPATVAIDHDEVSYLLAMVSQSFAVNLGTQDIIWHYSGVRPLYDDAASKAAAVTRDYVLDVDSKGGAAVLSVFGGKITTSRKLAEHALEKLQQFLPHMTAAWTADTPLPGGALGCDFKQYLEYFHARHPYLSAENAWRLARAYGTLADEFLGDARTMADLGHDFGCGLSEREIAYLKQREWAVTSEDILWRRSKLGLHLSAEAQAALAASLSK